MVLMAARQRRRRRTAAGYHPSRQGRRPTVDCGRRPKRGSGGFAPAGYSGRPHAHGHPTQRSATTGVAGRMIRRPSKWNVVAGLPTSGEQRPRKVAGPLGASCRREQALVASASIAGGPGLIVPAPSWRLRQQRSAGRGREAWEGPRRGMLAHNLRRKRPGNGQRLPTPARQRTLAGSRVRRSCGIRRTGSYAFG